MSELKPIRVMIVDDHPIVRDGLKNMLVVFDDLVLAGEAENGRAAVDSFCQNPSDVILMDILMPVMDGIQAARAILGQDPQAKIIMLTSYLNDDIVQEALEAGAIGYLLKNASIETMASAIRSAYSGKYFLVPEATKALIDIKTGPLKLGGDLSKREKEVLALIVAGLSNEDIAQRLVISTATAKFHVSSCISKLGATNRAQAAALAVKHGLVPESG